MPGVLLAAFAAVLNLSVATHAPTTVPMKLDTGRPSIDVKLNGKGPYRMLLDTGSGAALILDQKLATELGLKSKGTRRVGDPNAPTAIEAKIMKVARVEIGNLAIKNIDAIAWEREVLGLPESPRGVIGLGLFGARPITLDYPREKVTIELAALPEPDGHTIFKAAFDDGIPSININVAGSVFNAHVDTGSTGFLGFPLATAETLPLDGPPRQVGRARTASGDYAVSEATLQGDLRIGDILLESPKLRFVDLPNANLGSDLMRTMVVTVDAKNHRVRLLASGDALAPTERPRLGIVSRGMREGRFPIDRVAPGSAAEAAGLREGDEIVRLNDRLVAEMTAFQLSQALLVRPLAIALLRDGTPVELTVPGAQP